MRSHLLTGTTTERYRTPVTDQAERVAARTATASPPHAATVAAAATVADAVDLDTPLPDTAAALDELDRLCPPAAVSPGHPRHLAHLAAPALLPAGPDGPSPWDDRSAGVAHLERRLVDWAAGRLGLGPAADGLFAADSAQADLQALLLAREAAGPGTHRLRVLVPAADHARARAAARLLGLGPDAVVTVPTDRGGRLQTVALARELERCAREGLVPLAVMATAGTAGSGSVDPLAHLADLCAHHGVRLHVRVAYGCGLLASRTRRHLLDGIERADSVTVDFPTSYARPASPAALLVRDGAALRPAAAEYPGPWRAPHEPGPRHADSPVRTAGAPAVVSLWLALRTLGPDALGDRFDACCDLAARGFDLVAADPRFAVTVEPQLCTLVFRHIPAAIRTPADIDRANLYARKALCASGAAAVAGTVVGDRQYLRLTPLNPGTTTADLAAVLDLIAHHAEQYLGDRLVRAS
ncbi:pyridoxal-dependent decarboxylase [Streptomyces longispororuber]|uniref:Pyridoxal-dependent decarboxylase n=1 Tax=Streptomyces longispororuber TaxID=68230 RepID=A0A918ZL93_9ACTN|nr:pyridoxal-dependent decarboxylase [Streptomyces longispororuber]GHE55794.1 pyridoxal-dependent decarboxylase [Streptomyces longispororuber]